MRRKIDEDERATKDYVWWVRSDLKREFLHRLDELDRRISHLEQTVRGGTMPHRIEYAAPEVRRPRTGLPSAALMTILGVTIIPLIALAAVVFAIASETR